MRRRIQILVAVTLFNWTSATFVQAQQFESTTAKRPATRASLLVRADADCDLNPARTFLFLGLGGGAFGPPATFDPGGECWSLCVKRNNASRLKEDLALKCESDH
jgi:hypothetical protein